MNGRFGPGVFLTWQRHRRTEQLGVQLGIPVVTLTTSKTGVRRYVWLLRQSARALRQRKPAWLIVQSPSFVLAGFAVTFGRLFTRAVIVDAHNEAVRPYLNDAAWVTWLARYIMRKASAVIVTNAELAELVTKCGGRPVVLPDPLPVFKSVPQIDLGPGRHIAVILTYAKDEPVAEIMEAARQAPPDFQFHFTGPAERMDRALNESRPPNVRFTGFLPERDYDSLIHSVDAVIDLTLMPDCLVCGAYEALAAGVPSILSDNNAGRCLFSGASVFVSPDARAIEEVLRKFDDQVMPLRSSVVETSKGFVRSWNACATQLTNLLRSYERVA